MTDSKWNQIRALPRATLTELFAGDPDRLAKFSVDVAGIHFDFSKTHLTTEALTNAVKYAAPGGERDMRRAPPYQPFGCLKTKATDTTDH